MNYVIKYNINVIKIFDFTIEKSKRNRVVYNKLIDL